MALFGKLFGKRSLDSERAQADGLFQAGEFGPAKLAYERAQDLAPAASEALQYLQAQMAVCRDRLAEQRLAAAEAFIEQGNLELAREELQSAMETAASAALIAQAEQRVDSLEQVELREQQGQAAELAAEDRFEVISGGFEEDQYAEYLAHGEAMKRALLLLHDGATQAARQELESLIQTADAPRYLWFELGRARLADGATEAGAEALEKFLAGLAPEEGGDARLLAHIELAQLIHARGDFDGAVAHYEQALEAMPEDPRPYLAMSSFFRSQQLFDEAIEVLEAAIAARDEHNPDFRLWQELGLAYLGAGRDADAVAQLERMVDFFTRRTQRDLPPEGTLALATLYEKSERPARALDLLTVLAEGSDRTNAWVYQLEAARLAKSLGHPADARRMLKRASELAPKDPAVQSRIEQARAALEPAS
jgi:tetratricopeptide (TPR) repeat protein